MGKLGQPKVFVVVPVFQRLAHTLRCIADLEAQTYPNLEVVVVDGGSRDGSVDALRQLPAISSGGLGRRGSVSSTRSRTEPLTTS